MILKKRKMNKIEKTKKLFLIFFFFMNLTLCDSTARFFPYNISFDKLQVVSVVPAKKVAEGVFEQKCRGEASGLIFNINLLSIPRDPDPDKDLSIRPGDIIKRADKNIRFIVEEGKNIGKESIDLKINCLEAYPDLDLDKERKCQGVEIPSLTIENFKYHSDIPPTPDGFYPRLTNQKDKFAIALLIDHSGSILGKVYKKGLPFQYKELPLNADPTFIPFDKTGYFSDYSNLRIAAAKDFIETLNENDRIIVFAYGEEFGEIPIVVCEHPLKPKPTEEEKKKDCFLLKSQIDGAFDPITKGFNKMQSEAGGRAALWSAVNYVYEFMKTSKGEYKHIVVISDGPDTCHPLSEDYIQTKAGPCSGTSYNDFYNKLLSDIENKKAKNIHIHFLQFQSKGYQNHDPKQQEVACMTNGNYIFINSLNLPTETVATGIPLKDTLLDSLFKIRYSFAGVWKLYVGLPILKNNENFPNGIPKGSIYAIGGEIRLKAGDFTKHAQTTDFKIGSGQFGNLDKRVSFRKQCDNSEECELAEEECKIDTCLSSSFVCGKKPMGENPDCGEGKKCCDGICFQEDIIIENTKKYKYKCICDKGIIDCEPLD